MDEFLPVVVDDDVVVGAAPVDSVLGDVLIQRDALVQTTMLAQTDVPTPVDVPVQADMHAPVTFHPNLLNVVEDALARRDYEAMVKRTKSMSSRSSTCPVKKPRRSLTMELAKELSSPRHV